VRSTKETPVPNFDPAPAFDPAPDLVQLISSIEPLTFSQLLPNYSALVSVYYWNLGRGHFLMPKYCDDRNGDSRLKAVTKAE